jgi:hypothetical protein
VCRYAVFFCKLQRKFRDLGSVHCTMEFYLINFFEFAGLFQTRTHARRFLNFWMWRSWEVLGWGHWWQSFSLSDCLRLRMRDWYFLLSCCDISSFLWCGTATQKQKWRHDAHTSHFTPHTWHDKKCIFNWTRSERYLISHFVILSYPQSNLSHL